MASVVGSKLEGGHTQIVLHITASCLPDVRFITGAEFGEVAAWAGDGSVVHKFQISNADDDVSAVVCSSLKPEMFYVSAGSTIHLYDMRQLADAVTTFSHNEDEINEISLNEKETYLASCDDSGNIKLISTSDGKLYKTLKKHTNICASVKFRPHRSWELISGGFDSKLIQWDFSKPRAFCQIDMQEIGTPPESVDSYVVGPPFVHSLSISSSGNTVAVGTENGLVQVFNSSKRTLSFEQTLRRHTQGVSQVHFPSFSQDRFVISGGNDERICIWDLESGEASSQAGPTTNGCSLATSASVTASILPKHEIFTEEKIHWIASSRTGNSKLIAVADNSTCPTLLQFPE